MLISYDLRQEARSQGEGERGEYIGSVVEVPERVWLENRCKIKYNAVRRGKR
jgi:hypothetical protein